jgi:hypothetical protein
MVNSQKKSLNKMCGATVYLVQVEISRRIQGSPFMPITGNIGYALPAAARTCSRGYASIQPWVRSVVKCV